MFLLVFSAVFTCFAGNGLLSALHSFRKDDSPGALKTEPVKGGVIKSEIVPYQLENTQNTFNISQFEDISLPPNHKAALGFGAPGFVEWGKSEPLEILKKGFTHYNNADAYTERQAPSPSQHWFIGFSNLIRDVAAEMREQFPDAAKVAYSSWSEVSERTAMEIGKRCWEKRSSGFDIEKKTYTRSSEQGYYLLDEEQFPGDVNPFLGNVLRGWRQANRTCIINLYGRPINYFYLKDLKGYPHGYSDEDILTFRQAGSFALNHPAFRQAGVTLDVSGGYFRVPVVKSSIYEIRDGKYVLNKDGRRVLRKDTFKERIFGREFGLFPQPSAMQQKHSRTPDRAGWKTDVEWMLQELYLYQDYLTIASLNYAASEYNDYDISRWRKYNLKKTVTFRPRTEPWTYGGNDYRIRESGEYAILYQVLFAFFNGVDYVESWDNGWGGESLKPVGYGKQEIKPVGGRLYPVPGYDWDEEKDYWNPGQKEKFSESAAGDDNYSRYVVYTAAVQTFAKVCRDNGYVFDSTLRYIRFNPPVHTFKNKEILANGIYQKNRLSMVMMYPYLDENDQTDMELKVGDKTFNFTLKSRKPAVFSWTVPPGVDPSRITIRYINIDGKERRVRGVVDGDKATTYKD